MASTTFVDQSTVIVADWLNDVNTATYTTVPANTANIATLTSTKANAGANSDITSITGLTTPLAVTQGGTGATNAARARTGLGLSIGTDVAAAGAITASGLTQTTSTLLGRTTAGTGAIEQITVGSGLTFSAGNLSANSVSQIQPISASVGSNALTISASTLTLDFRSTTLGSGTVTSVTGTPSNLVISSGSTLGTVSGVQSDIAVLAINNAGTIELAAVNIAGGFDFTESSLISTTAEGGAGGADSITTVYSTTARSNVAYRVIGIIRSTQATAGTWATAPSLIQGIGFNSLGLFSDVRQIGYDTSLNGLTEYTFTFSNANAKKLILVFYDVSETGGTNPLVQLGDSGGIETSGYSGSSITMAGGGTAATANTTAFGIRNSPGAVGVLNGQMTFLKGQGNKWSCSSSMNYDNAGIITSGSKTLSDTLTQIKVSVPSGNFDAGTVSLFMEV